MKEQITKKCFSCNYFSGLTKDEDQDTHVICAYWEEKTLRVVIDDEPVVCPQEEQTLTRIVQQKKGERILM